MKEKRAPAFPAEGGRQRPSIPHRLQFGLFLAVEGVLRMLHVEWVWRVGFLLGWLLWLPARPYRRLVLDNLALALPELSETERRRLGRLHFARLGANVLCGFKLPLMSREAVLSRVVLEGEENIERANAPGQNVVYAVSHLSCWELLTQVPELFTGGRPRGSVYQRLGNPLLNALVLRRRQALGYRLFDRADGFAEPMKFVREGGCLGILVDQHAGDHGVWCPFFGRLASTTTLAALLARRADALLMPVAVSHNGMARWRVRFLPAVPGAGGEGESAGVETVTARLTQEVENLVREDPADWFWVHNRWKTPRPNFLLENYRRGVVLPPGMEASRLKRFEVIARSPNWLGDACMALPAVRAIKGGRPDLRLTVLGPEKLRDLWESMPEVDAYIGKAGGESVWRVAARVRATGLRYDAAILFTNSLRSTLELWLAGARRLAGFRGSLRRRLLGQVCPEPKPNRPPEHHALRYGRLAAHAGARFEAHEAMAGAAGEGVQGGTGTLRLGLCAGAEYGPAKRWPLERFAAVANEVAREAGLAVEWLLVGAPGEREMGERLSGMIEAPHVNLVGTTSLRELIARLRECVLLLTNDTGTMHLAAALGVPTVSIFGSTEPSLTGPTGGGHRVVRHHVPCSPCFRRECPFGHYDCMTGITVERVSREVLALLEARNAPAPRSPVA
jgi:heptosyltransferase-2